MAVMVKLQTMLIAVLSVAVVALAVILYVVYDQQKTLVASLATNNVTSTQAQQKPVKAQATQPLSPELERYMQKTPTGRNATAARAERLAQEGKIERLKDLQSRFNEISASGKAPDIGEVDRLLGELAEIQGGSVVAGVDLGVLRQNLRVAKEVQTLVKELQEESKKPNPDQQRVLEITKELQQIQGKLNIHVMSSEGATGTVPLPPAANVKN
jgi:ABC-type cobalt transport system substrate-binding protein